MPALRPFSAWLVDPAFAAEVVAPAYDSLTPQERYAFAEAHPRSYLNAMRSLEEFPAERRPTLDSLLAANAESLERFLAAGCFRHREEPGLYLYRMETGEKAQTGVVGEVSVEEYRGGLLKKHENTRSDREDRLARYLYRVGVASSPVSLAYRQDDAIDDLVAAEAERPPALAYDAEDGVRHSIWRIEDEDCNARLAEAFAAIPCAYLTDGHHRCAATARYAARREEENPAHTGEEAYNFILAALFPHDQLHIHPFNRCVRDLDGTRPEAFLESLRDVFDVTPIESRALRSDEPGCLSMRLDEGSYHLRARAEIVPDDPAGALDVNILQERILRPLLGIEDPRSDPRLDYRPGVFDAQSLERLREEGWRLAFATCPPSIEALMAVADAGATMPPKSTFFVPKLRSGIFVCRR